MRIMLKTAAFLMLMTFFITGYAGELEPFSSDGCSAFPDGTFKQRTLWLKCCINHDKAYWKGGSAVERETADNKLKQCVAAVGEQEIAKLMLAGVRVGGSPYFPTQFRWGYGWPYFLKYKIRGYKILTEAEIKEVDVRLKELELKNK